MLKDGEGDEAFEVGVLRYKQGPGIGASFLFFFTSSESPFKTYHQEVVIFLRREGSRWGEGQSKEERKVIARAGGSAVLTHTDCQYLCLSSWIRSYWLEGINHGMYHYPPCMPALRS